ncbi:MAG: Ig domain-containing protein [Pseudomonas sp.]|nr:Ig domain-containing protein [Pseudomonas sp.]
MILTEMSRSAPNDDAITFSMTASVTDTGSEVIQSVYVEDTPVAPSSVTVAPTSPTVKVGATTPLTATVLPSGASQTVTWLSASPSIATVNASTGVVTGVAIGSSVIMAKAGLKQGSVTVTVTAA